MVNILDKRKKKRILKNYNINILTKYFFVSYKELLIKTIASIKKIKQNERIVELIEM